jgi:hypothetical protein
MAGARVELKICYCAIAILLSKSKNAYFLPLNLYLTWQLNRAQRWCFSGKDYPPQAQYKQVRFSNTTLFDSEVPTGDIRDVQSFRVGAVSAVRFKAV